MLSNLMIHCTMQPAETEEKTQQAVCDEGQQAGRGKSELHAGDIGAIGKAGLQDRRYPFHEGKFRLVYGKTDISKPYTYMAYKAKNKGDEDKISQALAKIMDEDLTVKSVNDSENRQTLTLWYGRSASGSDRQHAG